MHPKMELYMCTTPSSLAAIALAFSSTAAVADMKAATTATAKAKRIVSRKKIINESESSSRARIRSPMNDIQISPPRLPSNSDSTIRRSGIYDAPPEPALHVVPRQTMGCIWRRGTTCTVPLSRTAAMPAAADDMKAAKTTVMAKVKRMVCEDVILGCAQINLGKNVCILFFIYNLPAVSQIVECNSEGVALSRGRTSVTRRFVVLSTMDCILGDDNTSECVEVDSASEAVSLENTRCQGQWSDLNILSGEVIDIVRWGGEALYMLDTTHIYDLIPGNTIRRNSNQIFDEAECELYPDIPTKSPLELLFDNQTHRGLRYTPRTSSTCSTTPWMHWFIHRQQQQWHWRKSNDDNGGGESETHRS
ncbi:hypothetical protein EDD22DRAFT_843870 [Suillus occidentalis]|nr:hypothetical protein EDD22DRAFT_843870 [Suillus occidentalis]